MVVRSRGSDAITAVVLPLLPLLLLPLLLLSLLFALVSASIMNHLPAAAAAAAAAIRWFLIIAGRPTD